MSLKASGRRTKPFMHLLCFRKHKLGWCKEGLKLALTSLTASTQDTAHPSPCSIKKHLSVYCSNFRSECKQNQLNFFLLSCSGNQINQPSFVSLSLTYVSLLPGDSSPGPCLNLVWETVKLERNKKLQANHYDLKLKH